MNLDESYRALGLKAGASLEEVRGAYHRLVKVFHPDRHQGSAGLLRKATEETKRLNLAYERVCKVFGGRGAASAVKRKAAKGSRGRAERSGAAPVEGKSYVVASCGMKLNWVAAGRFRMGSPAGEAGRSEDEGPQTEVRISRGFWLGSFAVTQEEWKAVAEGAAGLNAEPSFFRGERLPVEQVSWKDCQAWLRELNAIEEEARRLREGWRYRLPSEAEWEFVCRAGAMGRFCFGDGEAALGEYAWFSGNAGGRTHAVGEKKANAWGFNDMHGNVWEWCEDRYGGPLAGGSVVDPRGPVLGLNRVMRGGSWGVAAARCRAAYRVWNRPEYRDYTVGFRVALAVE